MKDNRGFSLIELLVVIAILAIVTGFGIAGLGYIFGANAKACANELYTTIGKTRITTMGKDETALVIYRDGTAGAYFKQEWVDGAAAEEPEQIGKSTLELTYYVGGTATSINGTNRLVIAFDRSSGSEKALDVTVDASGGTVTSVLCERIDVIGGGRTYSVEIVPATGKVIKD